MSTAHGLPVATAANAHQVLYDLGVRPWKHSEPITTFDEYTKRNLTESEQSELRFAPKVEVVFLIDHKDRPFRGFRTSGRDWSSVFALLPGDFLPIVGEYKHGADEVTLALPSGVPNKEELASKGAMLLCARREWEEETGLTLSFIAQISDNPLIVSGRQSTQRCFPFAGDVHVPIEPRPSKLDQTESLKMVLVPLGEWLKLIETGRGIEDSAVSTTFLALRWLNRLEVSHTT